MALIDEEFVETENIRRRDPVKTKNQILYAALNEFSDKGLEGARVDSIAETSQANKRMIYHYFGNKNGLYSAVLDKIYQDIRDEENELNLDALSPVDAITTLVEFTFNYFVANPHFIKIINNENLRQAEQLKQSGSAQNMHSPLVEKIGKTLKRGEILGIFKANIDPIQLYISIASLGYFYLSNAHTLSVAFHHDLLTESALNERLEHIKAIVIGFLLK